MGDSFTDAVRDDEADDERQLPPREVPAEDLEGLHRPRVNR